MSETQPVTMTEAATAALAALLQQTGAEVWRSTDVERPIPRAGLIEVSEGESRFETVLSPLAFEIDQHAEVVITVADADEPDRDAHLAALLRTFGQLLAADPTIGGAVDRADALPPAFEAREIDGAAKSARFQVVMTYVTPATVLA